MDAKQFFEPTFGAFALNFVQFCLRYFVVAGGIYWFFHVTFRQKWLPYRIQQAFPPSDQVGYEVRWSMMNTACSGLSTILIYKLVRDGSTHLYVGMADHGWSYFGVSILLCIVGYDTWIYWQHRWLHTRWLFRHVHSVHHHVANPTAFAAFAQHPIETLMGNLYFVLFVVFVPMHPIAFGLAGLYMFIIGINAHAGYEFYPRGFTRHRVFGWINTSTHHNMHHRYVGCNYGNWFNLWDTLMGTNHPAYHDTFEAVSRRRAVAQGDASMPATSTAANREAA
jgi:lathosterol oxidase